MKLGKRFRVQSWTGGNKMAKRKSFVYLTSKVYGGKPGDKTVGLRFNRNDRNDAVKLARGILEAVEYGKEIDITIFNYMTLRSGKKRVTVTAPI